jgi:KaiC/GvpD/RAD55 family RecA-like ATPase
MDEAEDQFQDHRAAYLAAHIINDFTIELEAKIAKSKLSLYEIVEKYNDTMHPSRRTDVETFLDIIRSGTIALDELVVINYILGYRVLLATAPISKELLEQADNWNS